ncbi:hypothetical protein [Actinoplanes sp. L3-i22]|nr:hypothetical protein [Actinoplanes sp. L3-i22]
MSAGLTVLAAANLRGRTSVLELITWCLRDSPGPARRAWSVAG